MPFPSTRTQLVGLTVLALACSSGEPIDPPVDPGGATDLHMGDTSAIFTIAAGQVRNEHHLTVSVRTEMAIFVQSLDGGVTVEGELDGMGEILLAYAYPPGNYPLLQIRTDRIILPAGKTLRVLVSRYGGPDATSSVRYRLFPYPVNRAPEHVSTTVSMGQVRTGEDIETSADIDEYALSGQVGNDIIGYLANNGPGPGSLFLGFFDRNSDSPNGGIAASPAGVPLEDNGSPMFTALPGSFALRVVGGEYSLPASYTFVVRPGNRAPETASATVGTNTVVSESFDYTGDVDEFTVHGTPGVLVNLILENRSAEPMTPSLETFGEGVWRRQAVVDNRPLNATTGAMPIPSTGDIGFRVVNGYMSGVTITGRGPYRVRVVQINPGPETASPSLTGTDSIIGEQIDEYDDRDEFNLAWPVGGTANIILRTSLGPTDPFDEGGPLRLQISSLAGDSLQTVVLSAGHSSVESGPFDLQAGNYRVRVVTTDGAALGAFRGPYSAYFYLLSTARLLPGHRSSSRQSSRSSASVWGATFLAT